MCETITHKCIKKVQANFCLVNKQALKLLRANNILTHQATNCGLHQAFAGHHQQEQTLVNSILLGYPHHYTADIQTQSKAQ